MKPVDLEALAGKATAVAAQTAALDKAIALERAAEAAILDKAIAAVKPALAAVSSRIVRSREVRASHNGRAPIAHVEEHPQPGLVLVDSYHEEIDAGSDDRGTYRGERLYLLVDGTLAVAARSGWWCSYGSGPGSSDEVWGATWTPVSSLEAMATYKLESCVGAIARALDAQLAGKAGKKVAAATARAARLTAIAELIR